MALRYRDLNPNQRKTLRAIVREGRRLPKALRPVLMEAAVQTVLVEKNAEHTPGGDRDSGGAFQQRPSQGWGPAGETVSRDARQFYDVAKKMYRPGMSAGDLAAAVQRPAAQYRGRYAQRAQDAELLLKTTPATGDLTRAGAGTGFDDRGEQDAPHMQGTRILPDRAGRYEAVKALFDGGGVLDFAMRIKEVQGGEQGQARDRLEMEGRNPTTLRAKKPVGSASGDFKITGPNPGRLKPELVSYAKRVAAVYGRPLTGSDGTGHSYRTVNGNVSQHSTGNATDIPARGRRLILMGQAALIAAGMPEKQARKQKGGLYNVNGHQIIFNTQEGGDHTDHLHISAT